MKAKFRRYAEISKIEPQEDGTLKVYGYASSEAEDADGETISAEAMKAALPDYLKFGAVREMHQPIAAGTAIEASVEKDGKTWFGAHVVDPVAVKKVETKVYKGFSIGGKVTARDTVNKNMITGLKLVEVSLVDRPANPEAVFTCYKAEGTVEQDGETEQETADPPAVPGATDADKAAVVELAKMLDDKQLTMQEMLEAAKAAVVKKNAAPAEPAPKLEGEPLKKSISAMCQFASLLQSISWLASDAAYEAAWEQDGSTVPAQLRDWLKAGVQIFAAMSEEEIAEMLAAIKPVEVVTITAADKGGDLQKAGARFSAKTKAALKSAHDACKAADKALADLGYENEGDDGEDVEAAAQPGGIQKGDASPSPEKSQGDLLKAEFDQLIKRVQRLESQPMPPKGVTRVIGKAEDTGPVENAGPVDEPPANATPEQRAHHEMLKVLRTGGVRLS